ncbi:MAG: S-methyl-5-thioribose-1-phosphate isomerase, partial [Firmicutes bacterium]|nr:S-methyl-5-thioribose-1-phosphate isomerase [Bacillota bacterium]
AEIALASGIDVPQAIVDHTVRTNNDRYNKIKKIAKHLVDMFPQNGKVLTQCFGETIVGQMLAEARERGNELKIYCAETRPYFQGARLTASVAKDMGFDVTLITDNMPAYAIQNEKIDVFTSAADVICQDGHVVNKVGTFQIAIVAKYMGIPYFVTGAPDLGHPTVESTHIEMRDPDFVLQAMGVRTAMEGVKGYYPSFDITPPHLVSGVVTDAGIFSPYDLRRYFEEGNGGEYDIVV